MQPTSFPDPTMPQRKVPALSMQILLAFLVLGTWGIGLTSTLAPSIFAAHDLNFNNLTDIPVGDSTWESVNMGFFHYCYTARRRDELPREYVCNSIMNLCNNRKRNSTSDGIGVGTACRSLDTAGTMSVLSRLLTPPAYYMFWLLVVKRVVASRPLLGKYSPRFLYVVSLFLCGGSVLLSMFAVILGAVVLLGTTAITGSYLSQGGTGTGGYLQGINVIGEFLITLTAAWWLYPVAFDWQPNQTMKETKSFDYGIMAIVSSGGESSIRRNDASGGVNAALRRDKKRDRDSIPISASISSGGIMVIPQDSGDLDTSGSRIFPPRPSTDAAKTLVEAPDNNNEPPVPSIPIPRGTVVFDDEATPLTSLRARGVAGGFATQQEFKGMDVGGTGKIVVPPSAAAFGGGGYGFMHHGGGGMGSLGGIGCGIKGHPYDASTAMPRGTVVFDDEIRVMPPPPTHTFNWPSMHQQPHFSQPPSSIPLDTASISDTTPQAGELSRHTSSVFAQNLPKGFDAQSEGSAESRPGLIRMVSIDGGQPRISSIVHNWIANQAKLPNGVPATLKETSEGANSM
ncbi:hypothetical protein HDU67_003112 [Dinochytrium kinnereticum]|nr:hypothetical protein HDU67_003112 [Dinochytrium kinnereticum]